MKILLRIGLGFSIVCILAFKLIISPPARSAKRGRELLLLRKAWSQIKRYVGIVCYGQTTRSSPLTLTTGTLKNRACAWCMFCRVFLLSPFPSSDTNTKLNMIVPLRTTRTSPYALPPFGPILLRLQRHRPEDPFFSCRSYTGYSIWNTYRAEWAFVILFAPERVPGMV
jgi:hypothetical protein